MKKKEKIRPPQDISRRHAENRLRRHNEQLAKLYEKKEQSRREFFRRRVIEAPKKKAPETLRTRAYYRFSKEYPPVVSEAGFRENKPPKTKMSHLKRFLLFLACVLVFAAAFTGTSVFRELSLKEPETAAAPQENAAEPMRARRITAEELREGNIAELMKQANCSTALFEYKPVSGFAAGAEQQFSTAVSEIKAAGFEAAAYISCFKDTAAAQGDVSMAVTKADKPGEVLFDTASAAWLNPFSEKAVNYLLGVIDSALSAGFTRIVLDNVRFPSDYGMETPYYEGSAAGDSARQNALCGFINSAVSRAGADKITLLCGVYAIAGEKTDPMSCYGGGLLPSSCLSFAVDARPGSQPLSEADPLNICGRIETLPGVFMLDACAVSQKALDGREGTALSACFEKETGDAEIQKILGAVGIESYILW